MVEPHYVDRHYLADYQTYYSRSFTPHKSHCARLHFFSIPPSRLDSVLAPAYEGNRKRQSAERHLTKAYLGFVVARPLPGARVGRTILQRYPGGCGRRIEVVRPYVVNVAGLQLELHGLAYQEQDQGAAVCASTALWSALQRVAYVSGNRTPTPSAVTRAAGSPLPASYGLTDVQMADALAALDYTADSFEPAENRALFRAQLVTCLESQLPVVLFLSRDQETGAGKLPVGHAVTITGFRVPRNVVGVPTSLPDVAPLPLRAGSLRTIYVHDDNLGSHAHYELLDVDERDDRGNPRMKLYRGRTNRPNPAWWKPDYWNVEGALVPKYNKMRLPIDQLYHVLIEFRDLCFTVYRGVDLHFGVRLVSGVAYKHRLFGHRFPKADLKGFLFSLDLPRHVGCLSAYTGNAHLCDLLMDATEVCRIDPRILGTRQCNVHLTPPC